VTPKSFDIPKTLIWEAYKHVKVNGGAAGIDQQTIEQFEEHLGDNLYKLWNRMCSGSYFPPPVKAVPIPKKSGGVRVLGIPTIADRVAQTVVKQWLEPKLDPLFHENSYGYRPGRSAHDAIAVTRRRCWDYDWIVELDVKGLFDNIDHAPDEGATQTLSDVLGVVVRGTLAESANANHGWRGQGEGERNAAGRCRLAPSGKFVPALCF
jgi:Reverse transcriptase (RNA-dependent DNA polymerase)